MINQRVADLIQSSTGCILPAILPTDGGNADNMQILLSMNHPLEALPLFREIDDTCARPLMNSDRLLYTKGNVERV